MIERFVTKRAVASLPYRTDGIYLFPNGIGVVYGTRVVAIELNHHEPLDDYYFLKGGKKEVVEKAPDLYRLLKGRVTQGIGDFTGPLDGVKQRIGDCWVAGELYSGLYLLGHHVENLVVLIKEKDYPSKGEAAFDTLKGIYS